ncbi:MAG: hypothetical protein KO202_06510 [Methanobacteriaceae archaeon]|jgi:UDP-N-acetylmuramyl pentapeptide synthase|nr:hypothetical protein [Methanobacteriaceae archaeon]
MFGDSRFYLSKFCGRIALFGINFSRGMGKSFPGNIFLRVGSFDALKKLAKNTKFGNILITGTNGKTTITKIVVKLFENDFKLSYNYESNTVSAIATGLLRNNADIGIFEYGIRDVEHGIPDVICETIEPMGVVYNNVSREHTQVVGVKNSFKNYLHAKALLSEGMKKGIIVANADNIYTSYIAQNKENQVNVNYYGFDCNQNTDFPDCMSVSIC